MHRILNLALSAALVGAMPAALAQQPPPPATQSTAQTEAMRGLREAESELRDVLKRLEDGSLAASSAMSRLRQALNEVERAMLRLPADARRGAPWQTAVKEVAEAMAAVREDSGDLAAARMAAGEAVATLPALAGAESGTGG